jgi:DNA-binding NarL/FixJ family response regulator
LRCTPGHPTGTTRAELIARTTLRAVIKVLLAEDEAMVRAGVKAILSVAPDIEVVAEAGDGRAAVELARAHRPHVVLLDIRMPVLDGLGAAAELRRAVPEVAVVMLTTFSEEEYITTALDAGASGFILKSGDPYELMAAIRAVHGGAAYLSPQIARWVIQHMSGGRMGRQAAARERIAGLAPRERQVLALVGAGLSNAEIAERLFLVEGTVKAYVSAVLSRLNLKNRVQAAVLAHEAGLVS